MEDMHTVRLRPLSRRSSRIYHALFACIACVGLVAAVVLLVDARGQAQGSLLASASDEAGSATDAIPSGAAGGRRRRRSRRVVYTRVTGGDTIRTNSYILPGDELVSKSGQYHANFSQNGIFRVYKRDSFDGERKIYELGTPPYQQTQMGVRPGKRANGDYYAMLLDDGNLVIQKGTDPKHKQYTIATSKISKGQSRGVYNAVLQDDGAFAVYNETKHPLWWSNEAALYMGAYLEAGDFIVSAQGTNFAILHNDSLATYSGYGPSDPNKEKTFEWKIYKSRLPKRSDVRLFATILENGDFQIFSATRPDDKVKKILIRTKTGGLKRKVMDNYFLYMQDDGELILYGGRGHDMNQFEKLWSSFDACINGVEKVLYNAVSNMPLMGPVYKEVSALVYSFKPWCKAVARQRMIEGFKSLGFTVGLVGVPFGFKAINQIKEKGWRGVMRVKDPKDSDRNYYELLEVDRCATDEEIKTAYHRLSTSYHPDKYKDPQKKLEMGKIYKQMTTANEVLTNPTKRDKYDSSLPIFNFEGPGKFFNTLSSAVFSCLGIRGEVRAYQKEVQEELGGADLDLE